MIWQQLIELVAPGACAQCGREGAVLCMHCRLDLRPAAKVCFRCLRPSLEGRTCAECRRLTLLEGVSVASHYDGAVKELILALKFHRLQAAAEVAAEMILAALPEDLAVDVVTAVPVSAGRYRERGYNQSRLIAKRVARSLRRPYAELLGREGTAHQLGVDRRTRLAQVAGAFHALQGLEGQRVLVVDDVVTTGATLGECARVLVAAGAASVQGAVMARH